MRINRLLRLVQTRLARVLVSMLRLVGVGLLIVLMHRLGLLLLWRLQSLQRLFRLSVRMFLCSLLALRQVMLVCHSHFGLLLEVLLLSPIHFGLCLGLLGGVGIPLIRSRHHSISRPMLLIGM